MEYGFNAKMSSKKKRINELFWTQFFLLKKKKQMKIIKKDGNIQQNNQVKDIGVYLRWFVRLS